MLLIVDGSHSYDINDFSDKEPALPVPHTREVLHFDARSVSKKRLQVDLVQHTGEFPDGHGLGDLNPGPLSNPWYLRRTSRAPNIYNI